VRAPAAGLRIHGDDEDVDEFDIVVSSDVADGEIRVLQFGK
jgi:hypothetical protein